MSSTPNAKTTDWVHRMTSVLIVAVLACMMAVASAQSSGDTTTTTTGDNNNSTQTTNSTNTTETEDASCGSTPGAFQFTFPYTTSIGVVGAVFPIRWEYSTYTTTMAKTAIHLYYQDTANGVSSTNWKLISDSVPSSAVDFNWTIPALTDSTYRIRINADGVDPSLDSSVLCIPDGFPTPSNTQSFHIVNALPLDDTSNGGDRLGPHSGADTYYARPDSNGPINYATFLLRHYGAMISWTLAFGYVGFRFLH